ICFLKHLYRRRVEVCHCQVVPLGVAADPTAKVQENCVIAAGKQRRPRYIVVRRRQNGRNPYVRQCSANRGTDFLISIEVGLIILRSLGPVAAIVHAKHDRHYGGLIGEHISLETRIDGASGTSAYLVATPS